MQSNSLDQMFKNNFAAKTTICGGKDCFARYQKNIWNSLASWAIYKTIFPQNGGTKGYAGYVFENVPVGGNYITIVHI